MARRGPIYRFTVLNRVNHEVIKQLIYTSCMLACKKEGINLVTWNQRIPPSLHLCVRHLQCKYSEQFLDRGKVLELRNSLCWMVSFLGDPYQNYFKSVVLSPVTSMSPDWTIFFTHFPDCQSHIGLGLKISLI